LKETRINYREALAKKLTNLESCYILDAGTGAGSMTKVLSDNLNAPIINIDLNKQVFHYVYEKVDRQKVSFVACDFANLPFKEDTFCSIICDLVISTSENWQPLQILKEFKRTLKAKSKLYITDYHPKEEPKNMQTN
jgi:ubiquinone/menaquinone biosynthesis C-methylase UbiE